MSLSSQVAALSNLLCTVGSQPGRGEAFGAVFTDLLVVVLELIPQRVGPGQSSLPDPALLALLPLLTGCLHALRAHPTMLALFHGSPYVLESLAAAMREYATADSHTHTQRALAGVFARFATHICATPLGFLWLHNSALLECVCRHVVTALAAGSDPGDGVLACIPLLARVPSALDALLAGALRSPRPAVFCVCVCARLACAVCLLIACHVHVLDCDVVLCSACKQAAC